MVKENIYVAINRNDEIQWVRGSSRKTRYFKTDRYLKGAVEYHNKYHPDDIWKVRKCVILEEPLMVGKHADVIIIDEPQNCEECEHWSDTEDGCADRHGCRTTTEDCSRVEPQTDCGDFADRLAYERGVKHAWEVAQKVFDSTVTFYEAEDVAKQIDKDINVRSKDEPQYDAEEVAKDINRRVEMVKKEWGARHIEDEPQTERSRE